ncbi:PAS domain-containing protein [Xylophilus sp. GOD-11R]|uniref:PAS domain-containing protein n=1 Tax=Xylophilus sp. GOD-11R TaxID=3089814 RepID=UPI00298D0FE8|nr:PAS domain-containing protein [Xylophilus sp. GOD-11R]WPB55102.1 PAS domain-containing protein [Xylophilus sp. GOD-11R]
MQPSNFHALFDLSPNPYLVMTPDFRILDANQAYLDVTHRTIEQLRGRDIFEAFPAREDGSEDESSLMLRESLQRVLRYRRRDALPLIRYGVGRDTPQGRIFEERFWSATHTPIFDEAGEVGCILQHTEDVTELHRLRSRQHREEADAVVLEHRVIQRVEAVERRNRALSEEAAALRQLFEQAPGFICVLRGPRHVFEMANEAYLLLIGRRDILGRSVREVLPELEGQSLEGVLDHIFATGERFVGHAEPVSLRRQSGAPLEERFVDLLYQPVFARDGSVSGIFVQGHDVTQQCRAQRELQCHKDHLESLVAERTDALRRAEDERRLAEHALLQSQKMEALGKLTGGVAHDFNNVLQVIASNLQLLKQLAADDARSARRIQSALAGVDRGARLASHLLAFARKQPLAPVALHPGRLLRDMDDMLRRALGESVELETVLGDDLWNTLVDLNFLENALLNLAINARDAMQGQGRLTIEARNVTLDEFYAARQPDVKPGQYVMIAVSDTGAGMAPATIERAFEPFFTTKPDGMGTGLGLSMVYGFVKQSEGHIAIYSKPGEGTTVRMYLPRSLRAEPVVRIETAATAVGGSETILVVEDDPEVREAVVDTLSALGYLVLKAGDALSALSVIESGVRVDLLFTDVVMPGPLRSPDLAMRARQLQPDIEVLFTSGHTESAIVHGGRLDVGVALLSKPYRQEELAGKIRHMFNNREQVFQLRAVLQKSVRVPVRANPDASELL